MNLSMWEFAKELWKSTQPFGWIAVSIWSIVLGDVILELYVKKIQKEEAFKIQRRSVESLLDVHSDKRLFKKYGGYL